MSASRITKEKGCTMSTCVRLKHIPYTYTAPLKSGAIVYGANIQMLSANNTKGTAFYMCTEDAVIKWKHLPRYWPFVRGIHRSPVNSPHKGPLTRSFGVFFDLRLNKWLSKQSWGLWFETLSRPLWRHYDAFFLCLHCQTRNMPSRYPYGLSQRMLNPKHGKWINDKPINECKGFHR